MPKTVTSTNEVLENEIQFLHLREMPRGLEIRRFGDRVRLLAEDETIASIVVTLPEGYAALDSDEDRYLLEDQIVENGGQLCFISYKGRVDQAESSEREFREHLAVEMDSGFDGSYPFWPVLTKTH